MLIRILTRAIQTNKKRKMLIAFDNMIEDILRKEKLEPINSELFTCGRKLKTTLYNTIILCWSKKILD